MSRGAAQRPLWSSPRAQQPKVFLNDVPLTCLSLTNLQLLPGSCASRPAMALMAGRVRTPLTRHQCPGEAQLCPFPGSLNLRPEQGWPPHSSVHLACASLSGGQDSLPGLRPWRTAAHRQVCALHLRTPGARQPTPPRTAFVFHSGLSAQTPLPCHVRRKAGVASASAWGSPRIPRHPTLSPGPEMTLVLQTALSRLPVKASLCRLTTLTGREHSQHPTNPHLQALTSAPCSHSRTAGRAW